MQYTIFVETPVIIEIDAAMLDSIVAREKLNPTNSDMQTTRGVLRHLAYNAVINGVSDVSRLDGFAADDDIHIRLDHYGVSCEIV